jgi:plastocyanin
MTRPELSDEQLTSDEPGSPEGPSRVRPAAIAFGALAVGLATVLVTVGIWLMVRPEPGGEVHTISIPAGTGARIDAGEDVQLVPRELEVSVNDTIRIVNDDDRTFDVGPFVVTSNSTLEHTFDRPGRFSGACTLHPEDSFTVVVT